MNINFEKESLSITKLKVRVDKLTKELNDRKKRFLEMMISANKKRQDNISLCNRTTINYKVDKIWNELKKFRNRLFIKNIIVIDSKAFIKLMKEKGIEQKELKGIIEVDRMFNEKALEAMIESNEITKEELVDYYEVSESKYITINKLKEENKS